VPVDLDDFNDYALKTGEPINGIELFRKAYNRYIGSLNFSLLVKDNLLKVIREYVSLDKEEVKGEKERPMVIPITYYVKKENKKGRVIQFG